VRTHPRPAPTPWPRQRAQAPPHETCRHDPGGKGSSDRWTGPPGARRGERRTRTLTSTTRGVPPTPPGTADAGEGSGGSVRSKGAPRRRPAAHRGSAGRCAPAAARAPPPAHPAPPGAAEQSPLLALPRGAGPDRGRDVVAHSSRDHAAHRVGGHSPRAVSRPPGGAVDGPLYGSGESARVQTTDGAERLRRTTFRRPIGDVVPVRCRLQARTKRGAAAPHDPRAAAAGRTAAPAAEWRGSG
jgi:hypothetical protein